ncbi:CPBP family glutamic-type intramembrane protease [Clostridium sardiniense]|uniref:CPBP family glutamic-type intramembrane protease n=1 Tax=Clostridium sardiniense TaxID=29369 RepID=UPI0019571472|nr:CPBP family glutamic-type intramembrane protease [Clostridium sardiniense]MBM7835981.1 membrane protease YdiL (CAAX protease family) [Clostridium sardiniense]
MSKFETFKDRINELSDFKFILLSVLLCEISDSIFIFIFNLFNVTDSMISGPNTNEYSFLFIFSDIIILGPLFETGLLILMIRILRKFIKDDLLNWLMVSLIFAGLHNYSIYYILIIVPTAFIFNYAYIFYKSKKLSIYWVMAIIHILCNLIAFIY